MRYTPMNLGKHELVGLSAHVVESNDSSLVCKRGRILDETMETIHLESETGLIVLPKSVCTFEIEIPEGPTVRIDGTILRGRPEDRMKKRLNRRR